MQNKPLFFSYFSMIALAIIYTFLAWRFTLYSLGIYFVPIVFLAMALLAFILKYAIKKWRNQGFIIFANLCTICFLFLIGSIAADIYKPTLKVHIPEHFEGTVYLWPAKEITDEIIIDENGMGYFNPVQEVNLKVLHGTKNISDALNEYGRKTLVFALPDSIHQETIEAFCFEVEKGRVYGKTPWNQPHAKCLNEEEYLRLVSAGIIDESRIKKEIYPR